MHEMNQPSIKMFHHESFNRLVHLSLGHASSTFLSFEAREKKNREVVRKVSDVMERYKIKFVENQFKKICHFFYL